MYTSGQSQVHEVAITVTLGRLTFLRANPHKLRLLGKWAMVISSGLTWSNAHRSQRAVMTSFLHMQTTYTLLQIVNIRFGDNADGVSIHICILGAPLSFLVQNAQSSGFQSLQIRWLGCAKSWFPRIIDTGSTLANFGLWQLGTF